MTPEQKANASAKLEEISELLFKLAGATAELWCMSVPGINTEGVELVNQLNDSVRNSGYVAYKLTRAINKIEPAAAEQ